MKHLTRILAVLLLLSIIVGCMTACDISSILGGSGNSGTPGGENEGPGEFVDYASQLKFDPNSGRLHQEVKVKLLIDGDTTHFEVPKTISATGTIKARYLAINTPESTGQIEPWGKKASNYTKQALSAATSIIIESDNDQWNIDSTGERYLLWIWYKTAEMTEYRNLNLEILQQGLAYGSNSADNSYGEICGKALVQAQNHKLHVHSKTQDPDFYYGSARPITLRELKTNVTDYVGTTVRFEAVVVKNSDYTAYVEEYDSESGLYFGMQVYYGFNLGGAGMEILSVGNRVVIVGSVQYYEAGGTYQISDIKYYEFRPTDEKNIQLISKDAEISRQELDAGLLNGGKVTLDILTTNKEGEEVIVATEYDYGYLVLNSSATFKNLTITRVYTTNNGGKSDGAHTITCVDENGNQIQLRTNVLYENGELVTKDRFVVGSVIESATGTVDVYDGSYQLQIFAIKDIVLAP